MRQLLSWLMRLVRILILYLLLVRLIRHFYKFPIPEFMTGLIDNPMRRRIQPPDDLARRHGIQPGMKVLDVGPGNGTYTLAAARLAGPLGSVTAVDISPGVIERVKKRACEAGISNIDARLADVYNLPFEDGSFDLVYLITVLGEIPDPDRALLQLQRVLAPGGKLAISELLLDPDYPLAETSIRRAEAAGFRLKWKTGNFLAYTLVFEKEPGYKPA